MPDAIRLVTSRAALLDAGWDAASLRRELASGRLVPIRRGIYAPASLLALGQQDQALAYAITAAGAVLAQRRSVVVSHRSAALMHGLDLLDHPGDIELTSAVSCQRVGGDIRIRVAALPRADCDRVRGVPVTSAARTVVDVARSCTQRNALVVADSALHRRRTSPEELAAVVAACERWPGLQRAREVLQLADGRAESPLETLGRLLICGSGLPVPELQVPIEDAGGIFAHADLGWPHARVVVECDGLLKYDGIDRHALRREKLRQERIEQAGWIVVRLTWHDVVYDAARSVARIRAAIARAARTSLIA